MCGFAVADDPIAVRELRRLGKLRDPLRGGIDDPALAAVLAAASRELAAVLRRTVVTIEALGDGADPRRTLRRRAESEWIRIVIAGLTGGADQ
jgi:hypothetical protein